jgi:hypothetical protein
MSYAAKRKAAASTKDKEFLKLLASDVSLKNDATYDELLDEDDFDLEAFKRSATEETNKKARVDADTDDEDVDDSNLLKTKTCPPSYFHTDKSFVSNLQHIPISYCSESDCPAVLRDLINTENKNLLKVSLKYEIFNSWCLQSGQKIPNMIG